jgi:hypothetical protein
MPGLEEAPASQLGALLSGGPDKAPDTLDDKRQARAQKPRSAYRIRSAFVHMHGLQGQSQVRLTERERAVWLAADGPHAREPMGQARAKSEGAGCHRLPDHFAIMERTSD